MTRDLVPRTIELTRNQITHLTAIGHKERRSVSFLVREAVEGYIAAYQQAASMASSADSSVSLPAAAYQARPDLRTMAVSPIQQKSISPSTDAGQWLSPQVNLKVKSSDEDSTEKPEPEDSEQK